MENKFNVIEHDDNVIGLSKDVIRYFKAEVEYLWNANETLSEDETDAIKDILDVIVKLENNCDDDKLIKVFPHPMCGFVIVDYEEKSVCIS